jgi:hypothetical protein
MRSMGRDIWMVVTQDAKEQLADNGRGRTECRAADGRESDHPSLCANMIDSAF